MTLEPIRSTGAISAAHPEVEFALVLARTIASVQSDPEQLRQAMYELARQKLRQLSADDPAEQQRLSLALEVAIAGVEAQVAGTSVEQGQLYGASTLETLSSGSRVVDKKPGILDVTYRDELRETALVYNLQKSQTSSMGRSPSLPVVSLRHLAILCFVAGIVVWIVNIARQGPAVVASERAAVMATLPKAELPAADPPPTAPNADKIPTVSRLVPTAYGVYAQHDGKLYALQVLPGHAPDPRVAISAAITKPSETKLPDGNPRFIVFEKDARGAHEAVEVRVIAQVRQTTSFDSSGRPIVAQKGDSWVIRNIAIPYQTVPLQENSQMYEIVPRDPGMALPAGRYALIVQGRSFEFAIDGPVTDRRQCLESLSAANGTFYSECQRF